MIREIIVWIDKKFGMNRTKKEMLAGAQLVEKNLEDYLFEICDIIHMQMSLKYQDMFVAKMIEIGMYDPMEGLEE